MVRALLLSGILLGTGAAQAQNVAVCGLIENSDHKGWDVGFVTKRKFDPSKGHVVSASASIDSTGGFCNLLTGTGDSKSVAATLFSAAGDAGTVDEKCVFSSKDAVQKQIQKSLLQGEYAKIDYSVSGVPMRDILYLPKAGEGAAPGWAKHACNRIAKNLASAD